MKINSVPVIDIRKLDDPHTLAELDSACREWGFFQVINHGIPREVTGRMFNQAHEFFTQPIEIKREISRTHDNPWGFFDRELTRNARDVKQVFDFGPGDGKDVQPQWPQGMPEFRNAAHTYYRHCERLAYRILAAVSSNLGMSPGFLSRGFTSDHTSFLRLNYYPVSLTPSSSSDGHLGVGQHTDAGALTLLMQDGQAGLEVLKDGAWHSIDPRSDALVINLGDIVQVWSNDQYFAALHRVIASAEKSRFSIPFFLNPAYQTSYAPVPTMVTDSRPARYRDINWGDFRKRRTDGDYADYGEEVQIKQYRNQA